jgi:nucleotide-binding universal stress UspA family protein
MLTLTHTVDGQGGRADTPAPRKPFARLVVASDGLPASDAAIEMARLLAARDSATVEVVAVHSPRIAPPPAGNDAISRAERRHRLSAASLRKRVAEQLRTAGVTWPVHVEIGQAPCVIAARARAIQADLVVVGHPALSSNGHRPGRHTPEQVACHGDVPVLAIRQNASDLPRIAVRLVDNSDAAVRLGDVLARLVGPAGRIYEWTEPAGRDLVAYAQRMKADVIALALPGQTFTVRTLLSGSVVDVLDHATCSVLVAPSIGDSRNPEPA